MNKKDWQKQQDLNMQKHHKIFGGGGVEKRKTGKDAVKKCQIKRLK